MKCRRKFPKVVFRRAQRSQTNFLGKLGKVRDGEQRHVAHQLVDSVSKFENWFFSLKQKKLVFLLTFISF